jgi:hypothetical protein
MRRLRGFSCGIETRSTVSGFVACPGPGIGVRCLSSATSSRPTAPTHPSCEPRGRGIRQLQARRLDTKRDYCRGKDRIHSAEDFIRLAGSERLMSGKAYRVACPDKPEVDSKVWLETARPVRANASVP